MDLRGAKILLTGATGGIGRTLAVELARRGGDMVLTGRRTDSLETLADKVCGRAIPADLTHRDEIEKLMREAGEIDVLIANAALPAGGPLPGFSSDEVDRALDVNLRAPIVMAKLAVELMAARRHGHLVFISSLAGKTATAQESLYSATKFGLRGFALALREDLRHHDVGVSTVFPGYIRDAGMVVDAGVTLPRGVGTRSPRDVARAVIRAIEKNRAEIDVAPPSLRLVALLGGMAPDFTAAVQRGLGAGQIARQLAEGGRYKN